MPRCADPDQAVPAGASIAGAEPSETAVEAIRLGFVKVIAPCMFVYALGLLLIGSPAAIGVSTLSADPFAAGMTVTGRVGALGIGIISWRSLRSGR